MDTKGVHIFIAGHNGLLFSFNYKNIFFYKF